MRLVISAGLRTRTLPAQTSMWLPIRFALGSRKRTKESIAAVRHLYIDIDTDGEARLAALRASDAVPRRPPSSRHRPANIRCFGASMASTSSGRKARSNCSPSPSAAIPLAPIATAFSGCPDSSIASMIRRTLSPSNIPSDCVCSPADFHLDIPAAEAMLFSPRQRRAKAARQAHAIPSTIGLGYLHELAHGKDAVKLTRAAGFPALR